MSGFARGFVSRRPFDTLYYHEWRLDLPHAAWARRELRLHAARDFASCVVFGGLAWTTWNGACMGPLAASVDWSFQSPARQALAPSAAR